MRIVCPSCDAVYDVPEAVLAARRTLRCARCNTDFSVGSAPEPAVPAAPVDRTAAPAAVVPAAPVELRTVDTERLLPAPPHPAAASRAGSVLFAWMLSFAVLGSIGWAALNWRKPVMQVWPASIRLYAALGYHD